jgi:hypothetical protein
MLVTAHLMVSWCNMTEQMFQLFSLHPSSAFTVTIILHCITVLLIKVLQTNKHQALTLWLSYTWITP